MPKINNAQRAAFARLLKQQYDIVAKDWPSRLSFNKWDNLTGQTQPEIVAAIKRHKLPSLRAAYARAEGAYELAVKAVQNDLEPLNDKRRDHRVAKLQALTNAMCDVWASQELDDAKAIVAKFVKA